MSGGLFIHILDENGKLQWFLEGNEASAASSSKESLAQKSWENFESEIVIFVPSADVYLTHAKLPSMSQTKLLKMVPFAIEDEIISDLSHSHFAVASPDSRGNTPIAVVSRECMDAWLSNLPAGIKEHISVMVPDVLALPWSPDSLTIVDLGEQVLVRQGLNEGFAIEKENCLEIIAQYKRENNHKIERILFVSSQMGTELEKALAEKLELPVTFHSLGGERVVFFSHNVNKKAVINILQGEYQSKYAMRGIPRFKRIFALMLLGWLSLMLVISVIKFSILSFQSHQLNNELTAIYNEIFPSESKGLSPKKRLESALASVKKAKEQSVFLRLMAAASPVLLKEKGISVQSANFSNSQLDIQLEASDFALLDKVTNELKRKGLSAEQNRANKAGSIIQSHLVIKEAR
jgi:general secretion pathway protein L